MRHSFTILAMAIAGTAFAQSALDLDSRARMRRLEAGMPAGIEAFDLNRRVKAPAIKGAEAVCHVFVKLRPGCDTDELEAIGAVIQRRVGDIVLAEVPAAALSEVSSTPGVLRVQLSRELQPKLDRARALVGVDNIHAGIDLPQAYTGKGVVTGIVDGGIDPNHINFKDADGNCRIGQFQYLRVNESGTAPLISTYTPEQLPMFSTDDNTAYHGTHTTGIMAGGYRGKVQAASTTGAGGFITLGAKDNPYYGVAYESEIAAACGTLQDYFIALGVSNILDYAYNNGRKPCVINLSLGSNTGPHDGRGMMSQYLSSEATLNGAIFCLSSGNEGDMRIALNKTFTEDDTSLQSFIYPNLYTAQQGNIRYGSAYVYSNDAETFDLQAVVYNKSRGRVAVRIPITGNTGGASLYYVSEEGYATGESDVVSPGFAKAFDGYVGVGSMIDADTGRFYAIIDFMVRDNATTNADGNYLLGFIVNGKAGQRVDVFGDGQTTEFSGYGIEGWSDGSFNGTISDLATTPNVVTVGSFDNRDSWISLDGNAYGFDGLFKEGTISEFSSFGTTIDGRNLPLVCAPGATIISSTSTPFVTNPENGITPAYLQASVSSETRDHYWEQMAGTSMASPLVAGSIALWLEADPTLTPAEVIDIVTQTATVDNDVLTTGDPVQWGAGKFNAYEGLKEVLRRSGHDGVGSVTASPGRILVSASGDRTFDVCLPGTPAIAVDVFDLSGRAVASAQAACDEVSVDLGNCTGGVYLVRANGSHTTRILVK